MVRALRTVHGHGVVHRRDDGVRGRLDHLEHLRSPSLQFDPRALNYTLLTLILSLQASYAAPLILLAQNRQADRDRVTFEQDRQRGERNLADTEYLAREVAALRIALREVATRDYLRSELRLVVEEVLDELAPQRAGAAAGPETDVVPRSRKAKGRTKDRRPPQPAVPDAQVVPTVNPDGSPADI